MTVVDAQLHESAPWLDWSNSDAEVRHNILTEIILAYLDALGVTGAILAPHDVEWGAAAAREWPNRLAYIQTVHSQMPEVGRFVARAKERYENGLLALRVIISRPQDASDAKRLEEGAWDPVFAACENHEVPVFMVITDRLPLVAKIVERYPGLTLIIDHLGLRQPPNYPRDSPPFRPLPDLLALARFPNVAVKICGLPSLSDQTFPFKDVVQHLRSVVDTFGANRLMWASDISRFYGRMGLEVRGVQDARGPYPGKHTYDESMNFIRYCDALTDDEKDFILGGTVRALFGWPKESRSDA
jgi:predicted TIM-barrel fold metal-dependent hydrolase